jgi:hypothetical protein
MSPRYRKPPIISTLAYSAYQVFSKIEDTTHKGFEVTCKKNKKNVCSFPAKKDFFYATL